MAFPKPPPPLTRAHVQAIGLIATYWADLEDLLSIFIHRLFCKSAYRGWLITGQMEYRHKRDVLNALLSQQPDGVTATEFRELMADISEANSTRTLAVHRMWTNGRKRGSVKPMAFESRGRVRLRGHHHNEPEYTAADLSNKAKQIGTTYGRLHRFMDAVSPSPPPKLPATLTPAQRRRWQKTRRKIVAIPPSDDKRQFRLLFHDE